MMLLLEGDGQQVAYLKFLSPIPRNDQMYHLTLFTSD